MQGYDIILYFFVEEVPRREIQLLCCAARRVQVGAEQQTARAQGTTVAVKLVVSAVVFPTHIIPLFRR